MQAACLIVFVNRFVYRVDLQPLRRREVGRSRWAHNSEIISSNLIGAIAVLSQEEFTNFC